MSHPRRPAERAFPLRLAPGRAVGLVAVSLVLSGAFLLLSLGNEQGLVWMGLAPLSPRAATRFYAVGSAVMGLLVFPGACAVAVKGLWLDQRVAFVREGLLLPAGFWSADEIVVAFRDVRDASIARFGRERVLTLSLPGRRFRIGSSWLASEQAFDEVVDRVSAAMSETNPTP